jgi:DNA-binding response OmpR family regulator
MPGQKILVVDDDPNLVRLVELILRRAQYNVITSTSGEIGIELARAEKPDLILMDVMLPGMDGFQAVKQIRQIPACANIPIVFLSASDSTESKIRGLRGGGNEYLTKPVKTGELLGRLDTLLRAKAATVGQTITVFGSKPGVGTTTLVVNLALALQQTTQKKVLVLDWQRPLGDVAFALGLPEGRSLEFLLGRAQHLDAATLIELAPQYAPDVWVTPGATTYDAAALMTRQALTTITKVALLHADYVVIDAGAFLGWEEPPVTPRGEGLNLCVLTPEAMAVRRAAQVAEHVHACDCDVWFMLNHYPAAGPSTPEQIEVLLGAPLQGHILVGEMERDPRLNPAPPFYQRDPYSDFSQGLERIADHIHKVTA